MSLSAFTIIKNANIYSYPIIESIKSLLPYVDEYIVNTDSEDKDGTFQLLKDNFGGEKKVKIIRVKWEDNIGTLFLSSQTNLTLGACSGDWIFYLQGDEILRDGDGEKIKDWIERAEAENAQGITFNYQHFAMRPDLIRKTYINGGDCYNKELRLFKNNGQLMSFGDGQSFCFIGEFQDPRGPQPALHHLDKFIESNLEIYHYGWLKNPEKFLAKKKYLDTFYQVSEPGRKENIPDKNGKYLFSLDSLKEFTGQHPKIMAKYLEEWKNV